MLFRPFPHYRPIVYISSLIGHFEVFGSVSKSLRFWSLGFLKFLLYLHLKIKQTVHFSVDSHKVPKINQSRYNTKFVSKTVLPQFISSEIRRGRENGGETGCLFLSLISRPTLVFCHRFIDRAPFLAESSAQADHLPFFLTWLVKFLILEENLIKNINYREHRNYSLCQTYDR